MKKSLIIASLLLAGITSLSGCQFDTDCNVGSQCVKSGYNIYGSCVGGLNPGNSNDRQPVKYYNDISGKKGNTCQFNTDCGAGGQCVKGYGIYGTCM